MTLLQNNYNNLEKLNKNHLLHNYLLRKSKQLNKKEQEKDTYYLFSWVLG
jgi:hypothetical protein